MTVTQVPRLTRARLAAPLTALFLAMAFSCAGPPEDPQENEEDLTAAYEELMATEGKADGATCSGVRPPDNSGFDGRIALTFDDGPDLDRTPQVLAVLAAHGARATFFVNGRRVTTEAHRQLLGQMLAAGHILGNHSQNHKNSREVSAETWRQEVLGTHEVLAPLWAEAGQSPGYFRFPFGSASCTTYGIVTALGYHVTGWHIDTADWCFNSATGGYGYCDPRTFQYVPDSYRRDYLGWVLSQARRSNGGILLMHDVHRFTAENLDVVLTGLEEAGFSFVGLDDLDTFPLLNGVTPPREPWVGDPCEDHSECDFLSGTVPGFCFSFISPEDETLHGFCSLPCEGYCPDKDGTAPTFCVESPTAGEGLCVSKAWPLNESCAAIPGTSAQDWDRFIGQSGASPSTALVCAP
jgi:peptidoglycan/xylan/chitin deacetylase (PgdA/CDA1 family)